MEDYLAQEKGTAFADYQKNEKATPFADYIRDEHIRQQVDKSTKKAATQKAVSQVGQITGTNDDGSYNVQTMDAQVYLGISSAVTTAWAVNAWVTVELANDSYQIVGYGAFGAGTSDIRTESTPPTSSQNGGASNGFSS